MPPIEGVTEKHLCDVFLGQLEPRILSPN